MNLQKIAQENVDMDMTPMIDCVFLLMIFFVLVIDLSQKNLEDLILPRARFQQPDESPSPDRPILNVLQNGAVIYGGDVWYDPKKHGRDYSKIQELLVNIRKVGIATNKLKTTTEEIAGRMVTLIDDPILIRADKWTEWHYVGEIMKQCSQPHIAFWKVELALSDQDKETGEKNERVQ